MDVYLLLGSNMGNKFVAIQQARHEIEKVFGKLKKYSSVYEAEPWGFVSEELFLNQVVLIDTKEPPDKILAKILAIERRIGRDSKQHGSKSRIIDIDILLYGDAIINDPDLTIPHPRMHLRNFALIPLKEIAPSRVHPLLYKTIEQVESECPDKLRVKKLEKIS